MRVHQHKGIAVCTNILVSSECQALDVYFTTLHEGICVADVYLTGKISRKAVNLSV